MTKDWLKGTTVTKEQKITKHEKEKEIEATDALSSQTVEIKNAKRMLSSKSKKATWY
jgi:hypothetical protein|tara:strand:- start:362 stop:532 length:171 start_codon:yes stop_codon:yes gene_type:complete